jgi:hypothetical protein
MVEAALPRWNNVLRPVLHIAGACSGAGDWLVRLGAAGSGRPLAFTDRSSPCTGVLFRLVVSPAMKLSTTVWRLGCRGGEYVLDRYVDLASPSIIFR